MLCYIFTLEDLEGEIWRDIKGIEGRYQISNYGRVKSCLAKLTNEQVRWIRQNYKPFDKKFGVCHTAIRATLNHKIHNNVK